MSNLTQFEEEIQTYEVTSSTTLQSDQQLRYRKPVIRLPSSKPQVMSHFPYSLVLKVETSEPRDVLQLERTCLTFVRFSTALFFTALAMILNFKIDTSGESGNDTGNNRKRKKYFNHNAFNTSVSYILLVLSLFVLGVSGVNYFITVNRYAKHKIATYSFNNLTTIIGVTGVILTLMVINITMIIEAYIEPS
ncbi:hypothetical protein Cantr_09301 [Candida viswanathii]|uniref:DUF202 domain-containing protein n=1 Tax=Candida viswanathii TaxID=5486 RepID=A0A367Y9N3_9ASCO|nr:hypothetical protein Cantr_09301 [Candida viswanathii]